MVKTVVQQTLTDKSMIDKMEQFVNKHIHKSEYGYNYCIVFQNEDGSFKFHPQANQPCWGELRPYNENGDTVHRPGDLTAPWPVKGTPVGVGVRIPWSSKDQSFHDYYWGDRGPFGTAVGPSVQPGIRWLEDKQGLRKGALFLNTKIAPDTFVNSFQNTRNTDANTISNWKKLVEAGATEGEAFFTLASVSLSFIGDHQVSLNGKTYGYPFHYMQRPDVDYFLTGKPPVKTPLLYDRGAYRRPVIESIYLGERPFDKLKNHSKLSGKTLPIKDFVSILHASI